MNVLSSDRMREWDRRAIADCAIPGLTLMNRAGSAVALAAGRLARLRGEPAVALAAGKGNNGGDACVAARCLLEDGFRVELLLTASPDAFAGDARLAWMQAKAAGVPHRVLPDAAAWQGLMDESFPRCGVVVDGLLGTGAQGAPRGVVAEAIRWILHARRACAVVAVDLPSGLDADTGETPGPAVLADLTITFGAPKVGFVHPRAGAFLGHLDVADIGLPDSARPEEESPATCACIAAPELADELPRRPHDAHKGTFGHLLVIGGSRGFCGAPALAAAGALNSGVGLVTATVPADALPVFASLVPGAMVHPVAATTGAMDRDSLARAIRDPGAFTVAIAGPGLSVCPGTEAIVGDLLAGRSSRLLLDADALNVFAGRAASLRRKPIADGPAVILTPHPGEAGRLLGCTTAVVQADRPAAARALADLTGAVVVLKGAGTWVCEPGQAPWINLTGNAGMATGGSGDVLAGIIGGLWAQGMGAAAAARLGVYLHGTAGDWASWRNGPASLEPEAIATGMGAAFRWLEGFRRTPGGAR